MDFGEFLSVLGVIQFFLVLFFSVLGSPLGFVGFSLVVKLNGIGLWVLEKIR